MAVNDQTHPLVPERFIVQSLLANSTITGAHGQRIWDDDNVDDPPVFPYIRFGGYEDRVTQWTGRPAFLAKIEHVYTVRMVRRYVGTKINWDDFTASYQAMRDSLTGIVCQDVTIPSGMSTVQIGVITQSRYIKQIKVARREDTIRTAEMGMVIRITAQSG